MTDDYAAVCSAVHLTLLLVVSVELHLLMSGLVAKIKAEYNDRAANEELASTGYENLARSATRHVALGALGVLTAAIQCGSLILICLWAAIDGHGPARWVAWTTMLAAGWASVFVVAFAIGKVLYEYNRARDAMTDVAEQNPFEVHG
ncbi:hypothetical protein ABZ687_29105 [Streptomyces ardesiacus]|uniref:hypothetical protein n=1 Tax=Streptomyces ardesiacus TaxID=285564 RepID=UPI0033D1CCF8